MGQEGRVETVEVANNPEDVSAGTRAVEFGSVSTPTFFPPRMWRDFTNAMITFSRRSGVMFPVSSSPGGAASIIS